MFRKRMLSKNELQYSSNADSPNHLKKEKEGELVTIYPKLLIEASSVILLISNMVLTMG